jgi:hypothetical protein
MRRHTFLIAVSCLALAGCGGGAVVGSASPASESTAGAEECIGYGCSAEQDAELDEQESEANAEESSAASPTFAAVGETVEFRDGRGQAGTITLHGVRWIAQGEAPVDRAPESGTYLVADFTVTSTSGSVTANPYAFRAQTPDGRTADYSPFALDESIDSSTIPVGRQVRGEVGFDIQQGPVLIDYTMPLGDPLATFQVSA